ncbi:MAG: DUF2147 domain-containing protein [Pseudomonadota bacterium]
MTRFAPIAALAAAGLFAGAAVAGDPTGVWKTEANDEGAWLEVEIQPCGDRVCGVIVAAKDASGTPDGGYEHLGRQMIIDMAPDGENKWSDGEIWAPDDDETYNANMELKGDVLAVEGCVLVFCRGQDWTRAN